MKKFLQRVVLVAMAMATAQVAVAESWRINNDPAKGAHFASINDAMASEDVKDGDVLYLDPGADITGDQTITKAVTLIGTGWSFSDRPYGYAQVSGNLKINAAAKVIGLYVTSSIKVNTDNIVIERCRVESEISFEVNAGHTSCNNIQVISSYVVNGSVSGYGPTGHYWLISNCIILNKAYSSQTLSYLSNATVTNNFLLKGYPGDYILKKVTNSVFKNNITVNNWQSGYQNRIETSCSGNSFTNNCMSADSTTSYASANICANSMDLSTFVLNNGYTGGGMTYQLCEGSPAIGAGEGGIDCGPYAKGSLYPFVPYGYPKHIPYFTEAVVPAQPTDGKVKVSLKIVNQND